MRIIYVSCIYFCVVLNYYIFEGNTGQIKKFTEGQIKVIAEVMPGSPVQSELQPPSMVFNGLAIKDNYLYISGELERSLFRLAL